MDSKTYKEVQQALRMMGDSEIAEHSARFFKTGRGEYGEGDTFLGIRVPDQRAIAKKYRDLPLEEAEKLLQSEYHEERLTALFILVHAFEKGDHTKQREIVDLYLRNTDRINNWDLVDSSAPKILGPWLEPIRERDLLYELARSDSLWERRIAMLACLHFIRKGDFSDALKIAERFIEDGEDLIHKAAGWMLREIGKVSVDTEERFLQKHYRRMPRTMLRYAIEKFPDKKRKAYLEGTV